MTDLADLMIGILGGTGKQGRGLGRRLGLAGHRVLLGSRDAARATCAAAALRAGEPALAIEGRSNAEVAAEADIVIVAVPWEGHRELLVALAQSLAGKIAVDCVNPIAVDERGAYALRPPEGSAAEQAAAVLPASTVVAAFHHVSGVVLLDPAVDRVEADVLVLGDDRAATDTVQALAGRIPGVRGVYAGRLRNAGQVEALTANLISVNRRYHTHASVRLTGL